MRRIILSLALFLPAPLPAVDDVSLYALFKDKAILKVDGTRRLLTSGEVSPEGIRLVSTDTEAEEAVIEVNGRRDTLRLGVVISRFQTAAQAGITLYADSSGFFHAEGSINGIPVTFLVDTGANTIAINAALARRVGLDYKRLGKPAAAITASGYARIYSVQLDTVKVGEILLRNVDAGVFEGPQPATPLLGMSFLGGLEMRREGNKMELKTRF